jgi:predicted restriction endonuclease
MVQSNYRGLFANVPAEPAPIANDAAPVKAPGRVEQTVYRIIRDTKMSREIKRLYEFHCQVCDERLELEPGVFYAEAHHLQPLGGEHQGPDVKGNLICLCPNHHALFDYFALALDPAKLKLNKHALGKSFVAYHNARLCEKSRTRKNFAHI